MMSKYSLFEMAFSVCKSRISNGFGISITFINFLIFASCAEVLLWTNLWAFHVPVTDP